MEQSVSANYTKNMAVDTIHRMCTKKPDNVLTATETGEERVEAIGTMNRKESLLESHSELYTTILAPLKVYLGTMNVVERKKMRKKRWRGKIWTV